MSGAQGEADGGADTVQGGGGDGTGDAGDPGNLFDLADKTDGTIAKDDDGKPVRPDWLGDQFWDAEKGEPKLRELAKSWGDLRATVSRGEHKPPESPDKYVAPTLEGLPPDLIGGKDDTLWPEVRKAAHAAGVTQKQLEALALPFLQTMAARRAEEDPAAQEKAMREAATAELAKLGPNAAQVVRDLAGRLNALVSNGTLTAEEAAAAKGYSTSAAGVRMLSKLLTLGGEQPIPTDAFAADDMTVADARRLMEEGFAKGDEAKLAKARAALERMEKAGARW